MPFLLDFKVLFWYRPLTKIRGMTLEKFGAKFRFLARVVSQRIHANCLLTSLTAASEFLRSKLAKNGVFGAQVYKICGFLKMHF